MTDDRTITERWKLPDESGHGGFRELLSAHVANRAAREATALDDAVWALLQAGAQLDGLTIEYWPQGKGDDPTPFSRVVYRAP